MVGDSLAPVDAGAEYVKEQYLGASFRVHCTWQQRLKAIDVTTKC